MSKYIDIAVNLTDPMFLGTYRGKQHHASDFTSVVSRAIQSNVFNFIITGTDLLSSEKSLQLAKKFNSYSTADHLEKIKRMIESDKRIVALGECGLDYKRFEFADKQAQLDCFRAQLELNQSTQLPLFLHLRDAADDFIDLISKHKASLCRGGVVHSFDGTPEIAEKLIGLGLYIGVNGCSLRTDENIEMVRSLPVDKIMVETDSPWCDLRPTHSSAPYNLDSKAKSKFKENKKEKFRLGEMVKARNEPCNVETVLNVVAGIKKLEKQALSEIVFKNTQDLFQIIEPLKL